MQQPVPGAIASLQASPSGIVRSYYPLKGNEKAMNHNLFQGKMLFICHGISSGGWREGSGDVIEHLLLTILLPAVDSLGVATIIPSHAG